MIVLGILMGYLVGYLLEETVGGWRYVYGLTCILAVFMFMGVYSLPPSCRWLALKRKTEEAEKSLKFFLRKGVDEAMGEIVQQMEEEALRPKASVFSGKYNRQLLCGIGVVTLQQITGQPSVLYYANEIFKNAGLASVASVGIGAFKLFATGAAVLTVDKFGRRLLLLVGISLMAIALVLLTFLFYNFHAGDEIDARQVFIFIAMFLYIGGYQVGFGPIAWLLISEIFPLEVRGQAVALAVQSNFFWNLVVTFLFPLEKEAIGASWTFGLFTMLDVASLAFVFWNVPETKGLALEEIEEVFEGSRDFSSTSRESLLRINHEETLA